MELTGLLQMAPFRGMKEEELVAFLFGLPNSLKHFEPGDIIAVCATGAYNYSMSSNYNRIPKPATVFINNGESRVVIKRETLDDIIRNDM